MGDPIAVHHPATLPLPVGIKEDKDEVIFINPCHGEGKRILADTETSVSELFTLLRQFVPPVCDNMCPVITEMLNRGIMVNDIDATTGMSMLHYVVRAECLATDRLAPVEALSKLLSCRADVSQRSMLTDMNVFHLAAFFNSFMSLESIINSSGYDAKCLCNSLSGEFNFGSPLHIAAGNLSVEAAEVLIKHGADINSCDSLGRTPVSCIPLHLATYEETKSAEKLKALFKTKNNPDLIEFSSVDNTPLPDVTLSERDARIFSRSCDAVKSQIDEGRELTVGDLVLVAGSKRGVIKFIGPTQFSSGIWCGVELDDNIGKNDGSINGIRYFNCDATRGVFAPPNKLILDTPNTETLNGVHGVPFGRGESVGRKPPIHSCTGIFSKSRETFTSSSDSSLCIGMTVYLDHLKEEGKIRYIGETDFAGGTWIGLSLRGPHGKNNGTVQGRQYFKCKSRHGIMVKPARVSVNGVSAAALL